MFEYSHTVLDLTEKEARDNGDSEIHKGLTVMDLMVVIREVMDHAVKEYFIEDDGVPPPFLGG